MNPRDMTANFHRAAELVKAWGEATLHDGGTVEDALTIGGLSFWSAVSPMLAFGHASQALSGRSSRATIKDSCRILVGKIRKTAFRVGMPIVAGRMACKGWPGPPSFLFLGFWHHMYRETMQPVAERIAQRSDCSVTVLDDDLPGSSGRTIPPGVTHQSLWQHWDAGVSEKLRMMRKALQFAKGRLDAPPGLPAIIASSGISREDSGKLCAWLFDACFPRLLAQGAIALHVMERHRPALIVSPDVNDPRTRIFCLAGKLSGIRTLEIQFGFYGTNDIEWRFFRSDHLAVTGENNLQVMLAHGVPREKMTVTGSPRYDDALSRSPEQVRGIRRHLGVPDGKVMVLFASQPYYYGAFADPEIRRRMMKELFRAASGLDGLVLVVKPHPVETRAELARMAKGVRNILFADKRQDIRSLIKAADAFVTFFSGTTFDALVMDKPTINLAFPGACANSLFERCGATHVAGSADDISRMLRAIRDGRSRELLGDLSPARERFLQGWFHRIDGRAAERIASIAVEMAS